MIGIVLVTHGDLGREFKAALEHVVGPQAQVEVVGIGPEDDMEQRRSDIEKAATTVNTGSGTIVLTDMFGGTPSNLSISLMNKDQVEVIAGVNLPLLIKLASVRNTLSLPDAVNEAQNAGRKYINVASTLLNE